MPEMPVSDNVMRLLARYSEGLRLAVEHGPTSEIFTKPSDERTERYVTGKFG